MKTILIIFFLAISHLSNAQLIDPFGKVVTHEIKLTKLDDGAYVGAMEWKTGGIDSLQRFVVKGLSVKAPVLVSIISKAPSHNIDVSFHKSGWDKIESKISTNGEKFVNKVFRTMNIAGLGVRSEVAGIPYIITIKVGLQFPSTSSLIRITDDKEAYSRHLRKMGFIGAIFPEDNSSSNANTTSSNNNGSAQSNNTLTYVVIGLLSIIIILLVIFLIKRKSSKSATLMLLVFCSVQFCIAQSGQPKLVPVDGQGNSPVFYEYGTSNVANQNSVPVTTVMNVGFEDIDVAVGTSLERRELRLDTAPGVRELTGEEAAEVLRRIKEANERFDREYRENIPGEPTEGDQRTLPTDQTQEELEQLRRQVLQLQRQVDLLSTEDEEYEEQNNSGNEILVYCDEISSCRDCYQKWSRKIQVTDSYLQYLQNFYASEIRDINDRIAFGNAWSNVHGVSAIAWQGILHKNIMPAVRKLKSAYSIKFDEYIESMRSNFERMEQCNTSGNPDGFQTRALREQIKAKREFYSRTKIID